MKRRMMVALVAAAALMLVACGSDAKADAQAAEPTPAQDAAEEVQEVEEEAVEETAKEAEQPVSNLPNDDAFKAVLDATLDWMGEQFVYEPAIDHESLTAQEAVPMATFAQFAEKPDYNYDEQWRMLIPVSDIENKMIELFGQVYPVTEYDISKDANSFTEVQDDAVALMLGDWGLSHPEYEITSVDDNGDGTFVLNVRYFLYDDEDEIEVEGFGYVVAFDCKVDESSKNGFVITNMKATHTGKAIEIPEPNDHEAMIGAFKHDGKEEIEGKDVEYTCWLVFNEDGTCTWDAQDTVSMKWNDYGIYDDYNSYRVMLDGDKLTLYFDDIDAEEVYTRADMSELPDYLSAK